MSDQLSIIFVIGAWHTEFHVEPILPHLSGRGYKVIPVKLHTSGLHDPWPVMQDNIDQIHNIMKAEIDMGRRIVILGHSVAGQPVAAALEVFLKSSTPEQKSKLVHMIFIACFWTALRAFSEINWAEVDMDNMWAKVVLPIHEVFYNDMDPADAKPFVDALDVYRAQMPPELTGEWKRAAKGTYFLCKKDQAVPAKFQRLEAQENGLGIVELDWDHCPMVSRPQELAEKMDEVLKMYR